MGEASFVHGIGSVALGSGTTVFGNDLTGTSDNKLYAYDYANAEVKTWYENDTTVIRNDKNVNINGDLVLVNSNLELTSGSTINYGFKDFSKITKIYISGDLLLVDSNIINNGLLSVGGSILLEGASTITGNGLLI